MERFDNSIFHYQPKAAEAKQPVGAIPADSGFRNVLAKAKFDATSSPSHSDTTRAHPASGIDPDEAGLVRQANENSPLPGQTGSAHYGSASSTAGADDWYRVRNGDTLSGIVRSKLKESNQTLAPQLTQQLALKVARINRLSNPDQIFPGEKINLSLLSQTKSSPLPVAQSEYPAPDFSAQPPALALAQLPQTPPDSLSLASGYTDDRIFRAAELQLALQQPDPTFSRSPQSVNPIFAGTGANINASRRRMGELENPDKTQNLRNAESALMRNPERPAERDSAPNLTPSDIATTKPEPAGIPAVFYKGVIGKLLDALPINPETRTTLQQISAVVNGPIAGRSLAVLTGLANPVLALAGLIWGIFSAIKIGSAGAQAEALVSERQPDAVSAAAEKLDTSDMSAPTPTESRLGRDNFASSAFFRQLGNP